MDIPLESLLRLVGKLDDSKGDSTPSARFRSFLQENVREIGKVRDYVDECLKNPEPQRSRAFQDLINHAATFLEFEVTYGRYQGVRSEIGFDGHWRSPTGFHIVAEVKSSDRHPINTTALVGYIDGLIAEQRIPSWEQALGLYIVGKPDQEVRQLENSIVAEKRTSQLRMVSVDSLLSLAEMKEAYDIGHDDLLAVLKPSGPNIDYIAELMARMVAQQTPSILRTPPAAQERIAEPPAEVDTKTTRDTRSLAGLDEAPVPEDSTQGGEARTPVSKAHAGQRSIAYWLTPVKADEEVSAEDVVHQLVFKEGIYAFGNRTPGRKSIKPGDWICFYATSIGIIAHARVASIPVNEPHQAVRDSERYPWVFKVDSPTFYIDTPMVITEQLRNRLDAFEGRNAGKRWSWFVQATRQISEGDFFQLSGHDL